MCSGLWHNFFLVTLFRVSIFIRSLFSQAWNLGLLLVLSSVKHLVRLFSLSCIAGGHKNYPAIERLLPPTGIEPTLFRNSASKVAGLQVHVLNFVTLTVFKRNLKRKSGDIISHESWLSRIEIWKVTIAKLLEKFQEKASNSFPIATLQLHIAQFHYKKTSNKDHSAIKIISRHWRRFGVFIVNFEEHNTLFWCFYC